MTRRLNSLLLKFGKMYCENNLDKKKGKDIPTECLDYVNSIVNYLKEHGLWSVKKISQWGNSLADVYEFEYIQISRAKGDEIELD